MDSNDKVIPIRRHVPARELLLQSFHEVHDRIDSLVWGVVDAAQRDDERCLGLCDDLRSELSEWNDICLSCIERGLLANDDEIRHILRVPFFMVSHLELMFLYSRKNGSQAAYYRKEIQATAPEFSQLQARIVSLLTVGGGKA
ncbi:hypothetical protein HFU84_05595 [Acidithiobacillus sp. CV18-2]|nr:hypothetical protein [Acidithiobacillus sp. CV18-3]MBU2757184.1 hypothetical protein [Acidithiobacillus sp. BN09-2]MBU2776982.1 hypothetical protein [Acidithiobacillus sp. CV18-2]MBU2800214.1 hypothetical protein [Acidithiobacillus sp. VAN18-4]